MTLERRIVDYGSKQLEYSVTRTDRKTLGISVHPNGTIFVSAPFETENSEIDGRVIRRARWITEKRIYFDQFNSVKGEKFFVSGATHWYLGRRYRLKIIESDDARVALKSGRFLVWTSKLNDAIHVRDLLSVWYRSHANAYFKRRVEKHVESFPAKNGVKPTSISIRHMKRRWGSMSADGRLQLNARLIEFPICCIDYVIVHELAHRIFDNHGKEFWLLVERAMPTWQAEKLRLESLASEILGSAADL